MLTAMFLILVTWVFLLVAFSGIGLSVLRALNLNSQQGDSFLNSFWIGFCCVIIFLQTWHLFLAVNPLAFFVVVTVGLLGAMWNLPAILACLKAPYPRKTALSLVGLLYCIWLANRAMGPNLLSDSGFYHLQSIRWIFTYPTIHGLGNLHGMLGCNVSYFLFFALLNIGPWEEKSYHIVNGLLVLIYAFQMYRSAVRLAFDRKNFCAADFLRLSFAAPVAGLCFLNSSNTNYDLAIFVLGAVLCVETYCLLFTVKDRDEFAYRTFLIVTLSAAGFSIKIGFAPLGFLASGIALGIFLNPLTRNLGKTLVLVTPSILLLVTWVLNSVILTGYLIYPGVAASLDVDWKVPERATQVVVIWIKSWARMPRENPYTVLANWDWLRVWAYRMVESRMNMFEVVVPLFLLLIGLLLLLLRRKNPQVHSSRSVLFLIPALGSLLFWFFTAPDPRFAGATFWYLGAGAIVVALRGWVVPDYANKLWPLLFVPLLLTPKIYYPPFLIHPEGPSGFYPIHVSPLKKFTTRSGLVLNTPDNDLCWDAPLPCTTEPKANLELRTNDRKDGFRISR